MQIGRIVGERSAITIDSGIEQITNRRAIDCDTQIADPMIIIGGAIARAQHPLRRSNHIRAVRRLQILEYRHPAIREVQFPIGFEIDHNVTRSRGCTGYSGWTLGCLERGASYQLTQPFHLNRRPFTAAIVPRIEING